MTPERIKEIEVWSHDVSFSRTPGELRELIAAVRDRDATIERLRESIRTVARVEKRESR